MVLLKGSSWQSRLRERLLDEARAQNLAYLAYLFTPGHGSEAIAVAVGECPEGPHARMVSALTSSKGRAELHWPSGIDYSSELSAALLEELESGRQSDHPSLSARLHATICQSLTAAHLHLELGLMSRPEAGEEFVVARELVHEATESVRDLIDELAGQSL